jgi:hypothetical protein
LFYATKRKRKLKIGKKGEYNHKMNEIKEKHRIEIAEIQALEVNYA